MFRVAQSLGALDPAHAVLMLPEQYRVVVPLGYLCHMSGEEPGHARSGAPPATTTDVCLTYFLTHIVGARRESLKIFSAMFRACWAPPSEAT